MVGSRGSHRSTSLRPRLPFEQLDGLVLKRLDGLPELEGETVDPAVGDGDPLGDLVLGEPELEPITQLQDFGQREPLPG